MTLPAVAAAQENGEDGASPRVLNDGYSPLYADVSGLANTDKLLRIKLENQGTHTVVTGSTRYLNRQTADLEPWPKSIPVCV